jgi:peptidyl-prolyl cis-trans isomerase D
MLTFIRQHTQSFVVKILAGLLIASFAVWGVEDMFSLATSRSTAIFEVGGVEVEPYEVEVEVRREINRLAPLFGDKFGVEQAKALGIVESIMQRQINETALVLAAKDLGVEISDDLVSAEIRKSPAFQGLGGFDRQRFQQVLDNNFMNESTYVATVREQMSRNQVLGSFTSITAPKVLANSIYRHRQEKRTAELIFIADSVQKDIPEPDGAALSKFHKNSAARFTAPEYRALSVIRLEASDLAADISVTDTELREAYEARIDELTVPETRQVKQMIIADEADAKRAGRALTQGRDFAAVAKEIAKMDEATIDLGKIGRGDFPFPELAEAVFALESGKSSEPLKSPIGWHLFRVDGITKGGTKTLDEVRADLKKTISFEKAIDGMFQLANNLEDAFGGGATLEEAAGQLNLKVVKIAAVDKNGNDRIGKPVSTLPAGDFLNVAFSTEEGSESLLNETGRDGYFLLRVDGVTLPVLKPLDTIKAEVVRAWKDENRAGKSKTSAQTIVDRVNGGASLDAIASEMGLKVKTLPALTRRPGKTPEGISQALIDKIFGISTNKGAMARGDAGYTVARLKKITAADPVSDQEGAKAVSEQLGQAVGLDILAQLAGGLRDQFGFTINREAVDSMFTGVGRGRGRGHFADGHSH